MTDTQDVGTTVYAYTPPEYSRWSATFFNIAWTPLKSNEPNWFHRKTTALILGIKWEKK